MGSVEDFGGRLADPKMAEIYEYWAARRGVRRMPSRGDVDPIDLPRHLAELMLVDVTRPPLRFRYRLVGTSIVYASGSDHTGRYFDEMEFFAKYPLVLEQYREVAAGGAPLLSLEPFPNPLNGTTYEVERLLLPLSADGKLVDMIIAYFCFKSGPLSGSTIGSS